MTASGVTERHKVARSTLAFATIDGSPNLTVKNIRLLKKLKKTQEEVKEDEQEVIFQQRVTTDHQFIKFLEETK